MRSHANKRNMKIVVRIDEKMIENLSQKQSKRSEAFTSTSQYEALKINATAAPPLVLTTLQRISLQCYIPSPIVISHHRPNI